MRLNAFIARCGEYSRRRADDLIRSGRVRVNGRPGEIGERVRLETDVVTVDDRQIALPSEYTTILLHKPAGYLVSRSDPHHEHVVYDLLPDSHRHLVPVGRLDLESEGLLLLSDDGALVEKLTHPRHRVPKVYRAIVDGIPDCESLKRLRTGIEIEGRVTQPAQVRVVAKRNGDTELEIVLREGRKRQVRLMCRAIGHRVKYLIRVQFGSLSLNGVERGLWRTLTRGEVDDLAASAETIDRQDAASTLGGSAE